MPRQAQAQTTISPVAGLVAFIQSTTDHLITDKWRAVQRRPKTFSMDEPMNGRQDSDGEAGSRSEFIRDPDAHKEIEDEAGLAVRKHNAPLLWKIIKEGLVRLSPQQGRIIRLYHEGCGNGDCPTDKEIAGILGTDQSTVKTQRSRAFKVLATYLNEKIADTPEAGKLIKDSLESGT